MINKGDRVTVNSPGDDYHQAEGEVFRIDRNKDAVVLKFDDGQYGSMAFYEIRALHPDSGILL